ncbi:MAG: hypothetical protein ACREL3_04905 [Gemmatimonadales bacterium]
MRRLGLCCCVALLVACEKPKEQPAADTAAAAAPAPAPEPAAPAPISLADVAGKWTMRTMAQDADSVLVTYELVADNTGWAFNFAKRKPVKVTVTASGDSLIADAGPYESVLRKGVQVTTHSVTRLVDGKLVGTTTAHYATKGADSVRSLRTEGTRNP